MGMTKGKEQYVVIGTGMAGLGAAYILNAAGVRVACYDKASCLGGHTRSLRYDGGFVFDEGGHISFTKDEHVKEILARNVGGAHEERRLTIDNYWRSFRIPHPVQCNLRCLPADLVVQIVADFVRESFAGSRSSFNRNTGEGLGTHEKQTYAQWLCQAYGTTFATLFPMQYGQKYHTTTMDCLTTDWIGPRMYRPTLEELIRGSLAGSSPTTHYVDYYRYPTTGGFVSYLERFSREFDIRLNRCLVQLDPRERLLQFNDGSSVSYKAIVSSLPLPDLIPLIVDVPKDVIEASRALAFTTVVLINIGVARADFSESAITYFYDEEILFSRINLPHLFSPNNAPEGCGCIQAEIYFSDKYKPLTQPPETFIEPVIADLEKCNLLREGETILLKDVVVCRFANIIYDFDREKALRVIQGYLDDIHVTCCGRYGEWNHAWTDQAFLSGERAARAVLDGGAFLESD